MKEKKKEEDEVGDKIVVRTARRAYWLFYLLFLMIIIFLLVANFKQIPISPVLVYGAILFCVLGIAWIEIHRISQKYEVNKMSVIHTRGLFNVKAKRVDHVAISEVIVRRTFFQRVLGVGDVKVLVFSDEKSQSAITGIINPKRIADFIEKNMMTAKRGQIS